MNEPLPRRRVAIACQGGGSHTAFTAGVLSHVFTEDVLEDFEFIGLSGTAGGAICALVAWSALLQGEPREAEARLRRFWSANSTSMPVERLANSMMLWGSRMTESFATPAFSPYDSFLSAWSKEHLRTLVRSLIDFDGLNQVATAEDAPLLMLGAVDVLSGALRTFNSRRGEITADAVLTSAAIPTMFRTMSTGAYWDSLFTQNPPVRSLLDATRSPDEIWVIQVNPTSIDYEPTTVAEIANRRNEVASNLALLQELSSMEIFDELIDRGELKTDRVRPVTIRLVEMRRPQKNPNRWGPSSKLNRDPEFIRDLISLGRNQAADFIASIGFERSWRHGDLAGMMDFFTEDAVVRALPGGPEYGQEPAEIARFVSDHLVDGVLIDPARKRTVRDVVTWEVRFPGGLANHRGTAEARFENGLIVEFTLAAAAF